MRSRQRNGQPRQKPRSRADGGARGDPEDLVRRREPPCRSVPRPMPHAPPAATRAACALAGDRYTRPRSSGSTRYRLDGSKIIKVYLDPKEAANVEYKVETFRTVYKS